ncbi:MAG TPA: amidohydrolase [Candidatus Dormibacteraeota bacterium]|nr:amidohydrolase [Candidatus Dormibacteraeota bacterium]
MLARRSAMTCCAAVALFFPAVVLASDTVLIHGHIYTGNPKALWAQALAISGTRIEAVGTDAEILTHKQAQTKVIDLAGRTVIPGISDSHLHMWFGGLELHGLNLSTPEGTITPDDPEKFVAKIKAHAAAHLSDRVLIVRADFSTTPPSTPTHELLDRAVSDRPVIVHHTAEHALLLNAKALALAGITDQPVADPAEEKNIIRDASGHPSGLLLEAAMAIVERALQNQFSQEEKLTFLRDAAHHLNQYGITSVVNATGNLAEIELYAALRDRGELTVRTRTSFGAVAVNHHLTPEFLADLEKARTLYHDDWVSANLVKFFSDGGTGLIPPLTYDPADYKKLVAELDKRGFQIMTHTYRYDTARLVLDAYEEAERVNGPRDRRLRLEHADFLLPDDLPRLARHSLIASMQPSFCCNEYGSNYDPKERTVSDRWQSLEKSGARLAFGSDWPCIWPPNPFIAIQEAVTRQMWKPASGSDFPGGVFDGAGQAGYLATKDAYTPDERLTVEEAVNAYTQGSAYARFSEDRLGTLEVGKEADLAVLSQDIFSVKPDEIAKTTVLTTVVAGKIVFEGK